MATLQIKGGAAIDLGVINTEENNKDSGLIHFPVPTTDSAGAIQMDLMGASRSITITGKKTGTIPELTTFVETLSNIQNGQQNALTYTDDLGQIYDCLIQSFRRTKYEGAVNQVDYTMELVQGVSIT